MPVELKSHKQAPSGKPKGESLSFLNKEITLFSKVINDKSKEKFYAELYILLNTGVDMRSALEMVTYSEKNPKKLIVYNELTERIIKGASISDALRMHKDFTPYEYHTIRMGEESGRLATVIGELAKFYSGKIKQKRKIIQALSYPMVVTLTAFFAVFFMLKFIVPMFADVFKRFNSDLPGITKAVITLSDKVSAFFPIFLLIVIAIGVFIYSKRKEEWFRRYYSSALLKTPLVGDLTRKINVSRFCHSMNLLLSSGTPLVTSLELIENMIQFYPLQEAVKKIRERVIKGGNLSTSLEGISLFDRKFVSLIKVGEEVNRLDDIFSKLYLQLEDEIESSTALLGTVIEPILIIFLGGMVALILVAMYLPLFKLGTTVGF